MADGDGLFRLIDDGMKEALAELFPEAFWSRAVRYREIRVPRDPRVVSRCLRAPDAPNSLTWTRTEALG
jgi:hypothetical protein